MYDLTRLTPNADFGFFVWSRCILGLGLPLIFIPITAASYNGLRPDQTDQASALINAARNTGGSIGVSIASNVLAYREQWHQSRLVEHINPAEPAYHQTMQNLQSFLTGRGSSTVDAQGQAMALIGQQVGLQASSLAYIDVFFVLAIISALAVPLALILRNVSLNGKPGGMH